MPETTDSGAHAWKQDHKGNAELNEALCVREGRTWFCGTLLHHLQAPGLDRVSSPKKCFFCMTSGRALGNLVSYRSSVRLVDFLYLCLKNLPPPRRECLISEEITTQHIYFPKPVFFFLIRKSLCLRVDRGITH